MKKVVILHSQLERKTFVAIAEKDESKEDILNNMFKNLPGLAGKEKLGSYKMVEVPFSATEVELIDAAFRLNVDLSIAMSKIAETAIENFC